MLKVIEELLPVVRCLFSGENNKNDTFVEWLCPLLRLIKDNKAGTDIAWNAYGKVDRFDKGNDYVKFGYDAMQNRVLKEVFDDASNATTSTFYVRDASGNVMATYLHTTVDNNSTDIVWNEAHLYGSKQLGIIELDEELSDILVPQNVPFYAHKGELFVGHKRYELSNHLGNVLAVVND